MRLLAASATLLLLPLPFATSFSLGHRQRILQTSSTVRVSSTRRGFPRQNPRRVPSPLVVLGADTISVSSSGPATANATSSLRDDRFDRTAAQDATSEQVCLIAVDGTRYNLTAWAKAHPGGVNVLRKFHGKDASKAFHAAGHSAAAYAMLKDFRVHDHPGTKENLSTTPIPKGPWRWRQKLFTKEDPIGVHKYLGIFCLLHFAFRFGQVYFGDPSAGLGTRMGKGPAIGPALCLLPHALLSLSSLIFHTVPKERVVGKPMIWQEYRVHNITFGLRSVICALLAWLAVYKNHSAPWRRVAVVGSCATALFANIIADEGTRRLRTNAVESTTATMPYWEGCSVETQKRFKVFYAYCQFMATLACVAVCNPVWSLAVLLAIQSVSLLMTLVRKGLISPKAYHFTYTVTLIMPYFVGLRSGLYMGPIAFPLMMMLAGVLLQLRRTGVNKYALWLPVYAARILVGDRFLPYAVW
jgi:cytochrome b involved in lipid metabolism